MVNLEMVGRSAVLTLDSPPANAINPYWLESFNSALTKVEASRETVVLHIRSARQIFCAGADLKLMTNSIDTVGGIDEMLQVVTEMQLTFARLEAMNVVTIAEIGGAALGGGLELALACDLRIVSNSAKLGLPEARLGLIPAAGGTQRLVALCGAATAKRLILGAEIVKGADTVSLGLAQWCESSDQLKAKTLRLRSALESMSPEAVAGSKRCIAAAEPERKSGFLLELLETRRLYGTVETRKRVGDFISKRGRATQ